MNVLEMRQDMVSMIMSIEKEKTLKKLMNLIKEAAEDDDWWDEIPVIHQERILKSYQESFDPKNWVSHEEVKKRHAQWLQK